jgi:arginine/lysine/histidine transporter system substrate-binding protein
MQNFEERRNKMKKYLIWTLITLFCISILFAGISCKQAETTATTEGETAASAEAATEATTGETAGNGDIVLRDGVTINIDELNKSLVEPGYFTVGGDIYLPGTDWISDTELGGYEGTMVAEIAKRLGLKLKVSQIDFDGIVPAVMSGSIDMGIGAMWGTYERYQQVDFTIPYAYEPDAIIQRNETNYTNYDQLKGKSVAIASGNAMIPELEEKGVVLRVFDTYLVVLTDVAEGNSEGACAGSVGFNYVKSTNPDQLSDLKMLPLDGAPSMPLCWPMKKGNTVLLTALNTILEDFWKTQFNVKAFAVYGEDQPPYFNVQGYPWITPESNNYVHTSYFYNEDGSIWSPYQK